MKDSKQKYRIWSTSEIKFLHEHYPEHSAKSIAKMLNRNSSSVSSKIKRMKNPEEKQKYEIWSKREMKFLTENYTKHSRQNIAKILNRSPLSVFSKIKRMNLYQRALRDIEPLNDLTEPEKAYIAAFIDGEGSMTITVKYRNNLPFLANPKIDISNSDKEVINWISEKVNRGRWESKQVYLRKRSMQFPTWKKNFVLSISNRLRIQPLLMTISPYLRVKRNLARCILEFYQLHNGKSPCSIQTWKKILEIKTLIDGRKPFQIRSRQRLAQFIKELERTESIIPIIKDLQQHI
ncbi:hypothetical protein ES703_115001 [subsurface metagenome]